MKYSNSPKHEPGSLMDLAEKATERLWTDRYITGITLQAPAVRAVYRIILAKMRDAYDVGQKRAQTESEAGPADETPCQKDGNYGLCRTHPTCEHALRILQYHEKKAGHLEMLMACKNEALGVFADPNMWEETFHESIHCTTRKGYEWNGADAYKNPMAFAKREMDRQEPNDSIGSVTHTM